MSSSSAAFSPDHFHNLSAPSSDQLCYVHCNFCDTVLAVSVPCSSLFKTVTVRCGHCTNLLSVNMRGLLLPQPNNLHQLGHSHGHGHGHGHGHSFLTPQTLLEEIRGSTPNMLANTPPQMPNPNNLLQPPPGLMNVMMRGPPAGGVDDLISKPPPLTVNRPTEKRQRVPSAYNRFIKDEIQRIKAENPDISHREAFSSAAKNWAHFPHIHFGLLPDHQPVKKANMRQQDAAGEVDGLMKDGLFSANNNNNNVGVYPY